MSGHFQGGMTQEPLKHEHISATIYQILAGEGVAIEMGRSFLHPSGLIVPSNRQSQTIHGQHPAILVAEEVFIRLAPSDWHILPQD